MSTSPTPYTPPRIVRKLLIRTVIALIAAVALLLGLRWWQDYSRDPSRMATADTRDSLAAVKFESSGQQAVVFDGKGNELKSPEFHEGNMERDLAWSPSGHHLYYVSDRENGTFQVFRWRPVSGGESEARTTGTRGKSNPTFPGNDPDDGTLLIAIGGTVQRLDPTRRTTKQLLPPPGSDVAQAQDDEGGAGGSTSPFAAAYGQLGESFRVARYIPSKHAIVAVMRRERGEALIMQSEVKLGEKPEPPKPLIAGDHIDFDVTAQGAILFSVTNFQWLGPIPAEFIKNGKATVPYKHGIGIIDTEKGFVPITLSKSDKDAFSQVTLSPDGSRFMVVYGSYDGTNLNPSGLYIAPLQPNGLAGGALVAKGEIYEPTWHPSGKKIAFARRQKGERSIIVMNDDGFGEKNLTEGKGNYGTPKFSPQK